MNRKSWLFLGVALSVIWALFAGLRQHDEDVENATNFADITYTVCVHNPSHSGATDAAVCDQERKNAVATFMENSATNVLIAALVPIPFGWLAGYILLMLWRIQVAGFRAVFPWGSLTRLKKLAVYGCVAAVAAASLMFAATILNLYTDARVPVGLGTPVSVFEWAGESVTAQGTWTRQGTSSGSEIANPLQISEITCNRSESRCIEARATVANAGQSGGGNVLLTPEMIEYEITSWENGVITFDTDYMCASESFSINIDTMSVSGVGRAANEDKAFCKKSKSFEREWTYRMEDGFKVYWEERQKNRPALLRIIQSFFGN